MISDGQGGAIFTWDDERGADSDIYAQRINAAGTIQWTGTGVVICNSGGNQNYPHLDTDGQGGAIITWNQPDNIHAQRINSTGEVQWTANGVDVCTQASTQTSPNIVSDGQGGAILAWGDWRSNGAEGTGVDVWAQRINSSGDVKWTVDGVELDNSLGNQVSINLATDGQGGAIVSYDDFTGSYDVSAQRVDLDGNVMWALNGTVVCDATDFNYIQEVISDGQGGGLFVWDDLRGARVQVYAQRINSSGDANWTADGVRTTVSTISSSQGQNTERPSIVSDDEEGAFLAYKGDAGGDSQIYLQHIYGNGSNEWASTGIAVCTATGNQQHAVICHNGPGDVIIAWRDPRSVNYDVYASRVVNGTLLAGEGGNGGNGDEPEDEEPPAIPGSGIFLIGSISIIIVVLITTRIAKKKRIIYK